MAGHKDYKKTVNGIAECIIEKFGLTVPVSDIDGEIAKLGGHVEEMKGFSFLWGEVKKEGLSFAVRLSAKNPLGDTCAANRWRNLTAARLIAHIFLNMGYCLDWDLWDMIPDGSLFDIGSEKHIHSKRITATHDIAEALLMPEKAFNEALEKITADGTDEVGAALGEWFHVPPEVAESRLRFLGDQD